MIYSTADDTIYLTEPLPTDDVTAFVATVTAAGSDEVKYTIEVDGTEKYWDGDSWETSNGTFAQANTAAEINTNATTLLSSTSIVRIIAYLHSDDGSTTPQLNNLVVTYSPPDEPSTCLVWGYILDVQGNPISGSTVKAKLVVSTTPLAKGIVGDSIVIATHEVTATVNANGYWYLDLIQNAEYDTTDYYTFSFKGGQAAWSENRVVPASASSAYADLSAPA
jgi:hypothetical protein